MELKGKTIGFLGDSITEGAGVMNSDVNRYDNVIKRMAGLNAVYNYGIGGTRIAHQHKASEWSRFDYSFCSRAWNMNEAYDIIVVFGGTNDYGHGDAPFGEMTDTTPDTFCGGVEYLINTLTTLNPNAQLVFMTPARRAGDLDIGKDGVKMPDAKPLKAYAEVIKAKCAEHNVPVLDVYEKLPINPNNPEDMAKYTADGLHLNDLGHSMLAKLLLEFLQEL